MSTQPKPATDRRVRLSRGRVLNAALALADGGGLESLTMRRLGEGLEVGPMALYRHVANKEDLIDGLVDLVSGRSRPASGADWRAAMRERSFSLETP